MATRPLTSSSDRPYTADGRPTTSHPDLDRVHYTAYSADYTIEEDEEEDESEDEGVFAFLPPPTADPTTTTTTTSIEPPSNNNPSPPPPFSVEPPPFAYGAPLNHPLSPALSTPTPPPLPPPALSGPPHHHPHPPPPAAVLVPSPKSPDPTFDFSPRHAVPTLDYAPLPLHSPSHPQSLPPVQSPSPPSTASNAGTGGGYATEDGFRLRRMTPSSHAPSSIEVRVHGPFPAAVAELDYDPTKDDKGKHRASAATETDTTSAFDAYGDLDSARSIKMEFDFDAIDEEDSPYPEVRASVSNIDDPEMPAMTIRMWAVGLLLNMLGSALNVFFNFRSPAPTIVPFLLLLVAHPVGKLLALTLPIATHRLPRWMGGREWSLNPGPWNIKEHALVFIMSNVAIGSPYALNAVVVGEFYYGLKLGTGFSILLVLATQLTGFGLAGLCRRFLVWPASMVWPQNLIACAVLNTLHAEEDDSSVGGISRYRYFCYVACGAFAFFFVPGYLFQALSVFSWVCWIWPDNVVVNQVFGVETGMGLSVLTFDWTVVTWIGSPLMTPWWAEVHIFAGFVFFYWVLTPILYYTDSWHLAHFPMFGTAPYDRFGKFYNYTRVLTPSDTFNLTAYEEYSPLYMPAAYAMTYLIAFALCTCVLVHTALYHGRALLNGIKRLDIERDDIHAKLMRNYPEVPDWWYAAVLAVFFVFAVVAVEVYDTGMPVWALLLAVVLPMIYVLPSGFIYAVTSQGITLNLLAQIVPGTLLPGKPLANLIFKAYAVQTLTEATSFVQDLKLGHYIKLSPRAVFSVQLVSTCLVAFLQVGVKQWMFAHVPDICTDDQPSRLTCPHNQVFLTASAIWGLIGPSRQFGAGSIYQPQLYAIVIGALLPIPFWLWQRRRPNSWIKYVSTPIILNGVSYIPPSVGINFSSWFAVGFIFQYVVRKRNFAWWSKFNYITSAALDSGTVVALLVIFFCLQFPKGGVSVKWWGNTVFMNTADYEGRPLIDTTQANPLPGVS